MKGLIGLIFLISTHVIGQDYLLENEKAVYSFKTYAGKTLMIAKDVNDRYLVYRYGTDTLIELEHSTHKTDSWNQFTYSNYYRGGGIENGAMELNYLYFDIQPYRYAVYWTYYSESNEIACGIRVTNQQTGHETDIRGDIRSVKGSLFRAFYENSRVNEGDWM